MKRAFLAMLRTLVFILPLSLCFTSCEGFDLEEFFGNIIKPSGDDEDESEEYDKDLILRELSEMEVGFICDPDYAEGADSYLFTNGLAMSVSSDSVSGYFVLIDSLDLAEAVWTESKRISIHIDSLYRPILAVSADTKMLFDYNSDESFSVISYAADGTAKEADIPYRQQSATRASTQSSGLDGIRNGLDILGLAQDGLGKNEFGRVNFLANMFAKALPEGLPQDFASLAISGAPLLPAVSKFLSQRFGYAAGGPLGWAALILSLPKTLEDGAAWLVEREIGKCIPRITSVNVEGRNSVDLRVEFSGDGFFESQSETPMFYILYWREKNDGERVEVRRTTPQQAKYGFRSECISGLPGGSYSFRVILYPSSFYNRSSLISIQSNIMHAEISPLYLKEVTQESASYNKRLLTIQMKAVMDYQSSQDKTILSFCSEYGVYCQKGGEAYKHYPYAANGSKDYYINFEFRREELDVDPINFKAVPKNNIEFGVYVINSFGLQEHFDGQVPPMSYTEEPRVHTGELVIVSETEATVKCVYEDCLFWNVQRGVEYFTDSNSESLILGATEEDGEYEFYLDGLSPNTTYKYRAYYEVNGVREYGETKSFDTKGLCPDHNHPHMIDLGLPSGTKWACCNVGASVPEGYGGYYAWGETEEKSDYTPLTYKYYLGDLDGDGCYYDSNEYQNIGSNISGTSYDVAHVKWGGSWRMPTLSEIKELCNKCSWEWTTVNGVSGQKVTGPNGNSIFLPAAGYRYGTEVYNRGSYGYYWSGTLREDSSYYACGLYFGSGSYDWNNWYSRYYGHTVRPVTE